MPPDQQSGPERQEHIEAAKRMILANAFNTGLMQRVIAKSFHAIKDLDPRVAYNDIEFEFTYGLPHLPPRILIVPRLKLNRSLPKYYSRQSVTFKFCNLFRSEDDMKRATESIWANIGEEEMTALIEEALEFCRKKARENAEANLTLKDTMDPEKFAFLQQEDEANVRMVDEIEQAFLQGRYRVVAGTDGGLRILGAEGGT